MVHQHSLDFSINDIELLCQYYLTYLYKDIEGKAGFKPTDVCQTYGEILYPGIEKLLKFIRPLESDIFMDFGSGLGKAVLQVFLNSSVKAAFGIECVPELYKQAEAAASLAREELSLTFTKTRTLDFICGDFLQESLDEVTIAFVNSTCFTQTLLNTLGLRLDVAPNIHTILSMRPINSLTNFKFVKSLGIECSWDAALCYIYRRRL